MKPEAEWGGRGFWASAEQSDFGMTFATPTEQLHDITHSATFLRRHWKAMAIRATDTVGLDVAAGIGRVSAELLLDFAGSVEVQELVPALAAHAAARLGRRLAAPPHVCPLQTFYPSKSAYSLIWLQWALEHLSDQEIVHSLRRLKSALRPDGRMFIKESIDVQIGRRKEDALDEVYPWASYFPEDGSYVRQKYYLLRLIRSAGLSILESELSWWPPREEEGTGLPMLLIAVV